MKSEEKQVIKIYPSSSAFMVGAAVVSDSNKSCPKYQAALALTGLRSRDLPQEVAAEYAGLGALNEARIAEKLRRAGTPFEREKPFQIAYKDGLISGRVDFQLLDGSILEIKATTSEYVYKKVFEQGEPKLSWVAQAASYVSLLKAPRCTIIASYYELTEAYDGFQIVAEKEFVVSVDSGQILVNGVVYPYTEKDLARWYATMYKTSADPFAPAAELQQDTNPYASPCNSCPLREPCKTRKTFSQIEDELRSSLLAPQPIRDFKIRVNTARRAKNRSKKNESSKVSSEV